MDRHDSKIKVRDSRDCPDKVCVVDALAVVAFGLAKRIPEGIDGAALEPDHEDLRDIQDDVEDGHGDETAADLGI